MKLIIIFALLVSSATIVYGVDWYLPPSGSGVLQNPPDENSASNGSVTAAENSSTFVYAFGERMGTLNIGNWRVPGYHWYAPIPQSEEYSTYFQGATNVFLKSPEGPTRYELNLIGAGTAERPNSGVWQCGTESPPLFGLPQITQKGDTDPYGTDSTIAKAGCYLCSILAGAKQINRCPWSKEEFNNYIKLSRGFSHDDILTPVAAKLVGMKYIGEFKYTAANVQKYQARGWLEVLRNGVRHWNKKNQLYYSIHFTGEPRGVTLKNNEAIQSIMDPMLRASYLPYSRYKVLSIRVFAPLVAVDSGSLWSIPCIWTKPLWWKKPVPNPPNWQPFGPITLAMNFPDNPDISLTTIGLSRLDAESSAGAMIEGVQTPSYQLTLANSEEVYEYASIINDFTPAEHDDTDPIDESDEPVVLPPDDHSRAGIGDALKGDYVYHLTGTAGTTWVLAIVPTDDMGNPMDEVTLTGTFDETGCATATYHFEPGMVVYQLGAIRQLSAGASVLLQQEVTDSNDSEFFVENGDRSAGARVISSANPAAGSIVQVQGKIVQTSPEITIEARGLETISSGSAKIEPLGMPNFNWPEMANCLLAKIAGKVIWVEGSNVTITNGSSNITLTNVDIPVAIDDFITAKGILRANKEIRLKPGSCELIK